MSYSSLMFAITEAARDVARALAETEAFEQSCRDRKRVEMLFAHLKRILRLGRLRLRGPLVPRMSSRSPPRPESAPTRQTGRHAATDSRCRPCLDKAAVILHRSRPARLIEGRSGRTGSTNRESHLAVAIDDFCNKIGTNRTSTERTGMSAFEGKPVIGGAPMSVNNAMDGAYSEASEYSAAEFGSGNDPVCARRIHGGR